VRSLLAAAIALTALAGCTADGTERIGEGALTRDEDVLVRNGGASEQVRQAAEAYSDAFLTGDADAAFRLLSRRCRETIGIAAFGDIVDEAADLYGSPLAFTSFRADVKGSKASLTYTYDVPALDQVDEPWVQRGGQWRNDDCSQQTGY
jgi:hypothetical protein